LENKKGVGDTITEFVVRKQRITVSPLGVRWMLAPNFSSVTLVVPQTCLQVPASMQTSSPLDFAEYT
jgi:hypothetical protein